MVDDRGKRGSVEHTFRAADDTRSGQLRATDLLIADTAVQTRERELAAGGRPPNSPRATMHGYIELYSEAPEALNNASVVFEVAQNEAWARARQRGRPRHAAADRAPTRRAVEGSVPDRAAAAGRVRGASRLSVDGKKVGQVTRPFRVGRTGDTGAHDVDAWVLTVARRRAAPIPFASRIDDFDRGAVLSTAGRRLLPRSHELGGAR